MVTSPRSRSARKCDAALPNSTAKAKWRAVSSFFARAKMPAKRSQRSRTSSIHSRRASRQEWRSEEHTSELQSLMRISYAVFCLKKKKKQTVVSKITNKKKQQTD